MYKVVKSSTVEGVSGLIKVGSISLFSRWARLAMCLLSFAIQLFARRR